MPAHPFPPPADHRYLLRAPPVMPNGPIRHEMLAANLGHLLIHALVGRRLSVHKNDEHLRIAPIRVGYTFLYPDLWVTCDEPHPAPNPAVLIEIVSRTSEAKDRGMKFARYRMLDSLAEYVLVSQDEVRVQVFKRQPSSQWLMTDYSGLDSSCRLESLDCSIPLSAIYAQIDFPESPVDPS